MYRAYKDRAAFYLVYIREAHPAEGWQVEVNERANVIYSTPKTVDDRAAIASDCVKNLGLSLPCLLDDMSNTVGRTYQAWPARACVVDKAGKFGYVSRASPQGVNPAEIERALKELEGGAGTKKE